VGNSIAILAQSAKYFAAPYLAEAIGCDLYSIDGSQNGFFCGGTQAKRWQINSRIDCRHLIIIGTMALRAVAKQIERGWYESVAVIFSDTNCCHYRKWWNPFAVLNNVHVYAMPDLADYCECEWVPVYQTMTMPNVSRKKSNLNLVVCHSPGMKGQFKGTKQIQKDLANLLPKYGCDYQELVDKPWADCIYTKASAHIFIDQLVYGNTHINQKRFGGEVAYRGAIGKSGLEGMLLKCAVITGCPRPTTAPYFPEPPVVFTAYNRFSDDLERLIADVEYRETVAEQQHAWALKYLSPEFVSKHVTRHIKSRAAV
jgi:hypothetical protein